MGPPAPGAPTTYDELPYESRPFPSSHPDRLAMVGILFGLDPPDPAACRVLELGCAAGGNLIPMAFELPHSSFVGVDLSERQIAEGQDVVARLGVSNVILRHLSVTDVDETFGEFDYIIAHGIYSWVPPQIQDRILRICAERLAPHGLAFVSYNTYPGWYLRGMVRGMLLHHVTGRTGATEQVLAARALLDLLATSTKGREESPFVQSLSRELDLLSGNDDSYLFHDHLEEHNEALWFHEFVARAGARGLRYVSESRVASTLLAKSPPAVQEKLRSITTDRMETEQYLDFLRNRTFRQTILCHADVVPSPHPVQERIGRLMVGAPAKDEVEGGPTIRGSLLRAAVTHLLEQWPAWVTFEQALGAAREHSGANGDDDPRLMAGLLACFVADLVELHSIAPAFVTSVSERPAATALARLQAERGSSVTNLRHQSVQLGPSQLRVLALLDGTRDRAAVVAELARHGGKAVEPALDEVLAELAAKAMLSS